MANILFYQKWSLKFCICGSFGPDVNFDSVYADVAP